jgi:catechol 2,3-dioxygenase-like lactoylglutathione lyase family enzyme
VLTRIDHTVVGVPNLEEGIEIYRRIGFDVRYGGSHPGANTAAAFAFFDDDYLELRAVREGAEASASDPFVSFMQRRGGGLFRIAVRSDDLAEDIAAMRRRGVEVEGPMEGELLTADGHTLRWSSAELGSNNPLPLSFIQHLTPLDERWDHLPRSDPHPNTALRLERAYVAVSNVREAATDYSSVLGMPVPTLERGTVINSLMAVFHLGPTGLAVAEPTEPGTTSAALADRGPGPFQVLYRTRSIEVADAWIQDHGLPASTRGVRLSGEHAMLVAAADACGVFLGFAGRE